MTHAAAFWDSSLPSALSLFSLARFDGIARGPGWMSNYGSAARCPPHPDCLPPQAPLGMQPLADGKTKDRGGGAGRDRLRSPC